MPRPNPAPRPRLAPPGPAPELVSRTLKVRELRPRPRAGGWSGEAIYYATWGELKAYASTFFSIFSFSGPGSVPF